MDMATTFRLQIQVPCTAITFGRNLMQSASISATPGGVGGDEGEHICSKSRFDVKSCDQSGFGLGVKIYDQSVRRVNGTLSGESSSVKNTSNSNSNSNKSCSDCNTTINANVSSNASMNTNNDTTFNTNASSRASKNNDNNNSGGNSDGANTGCKKHTSLAGYRTVWGNLESLGDAASVIRPTNAAITDLNFPGDT